MLTYIKKHYHWIIAVIVFLEMIVYGGLINSASLFIQPISETLGVPTTAYSVAMMPYTVTCFIGTSLSGYLFSHFGYKKTALASLVLIAGSLVLTANANNLIVFSISKILFGMGYGACFTAGAVYIIKGWFWKHQGLVLGEYGHRSRRQLDDRDPFLHHRCFRLADSQLCGSAHGCDRGCSVSADREQAGKHEA